MNVKSIYPVLFLIWFCTPPCQHSYCCGFPSSHSAKPSQKFCCFWIQYRIFRG